jgi:hypothetical protein
VKLRHAGKNGYVFDLHPREKQLLLETVELYPLVPASHHRLSKNHDAHKADENQRLLEESLAAHRQEKRREILAMLNEPKRFSETKSGLQLQLSAAEVEWLLQVLNDVRVGSWLALGEPEPGEESVVNEENAQLYFALEICGMFQSELLAGLGVTESQDWMSE